MVVQTLSLGDTSQMKHDVTIAALVALAGILGPSHACADDYGKDTLKGVTSFQIATVMFDQETQVRLTLTPEQLRDKIESVLAGGGIKVVKQDGLPAVDVSVKMVKTTLPTTPPATFWVYRVDTAVKQAVSINRPAPAPAVQATIPTWRMIGGGLLFSDLMPASRECSSRVILRGLSPIGRR